MRLNRGLLLLVLGVGMVSGSFAKPYLPEDLVHPQKECWRVWQKEPRFGYKRGSGEKPYLFNVIPGESIKTRHKRYQVFEDTFERNQCWKEWLIVVYMAADNDLSPYSWRDIWEMEQVGSTDSVDIIVFHDDDQLEGTRYFHIAKNPVKHGWKKYQADVTKYAKAQGLAELSKTAQELEYLNEHGPEIVVSPPARLKPETNSGDVKVAGKFLTWALTRYPSRRVMLIGWSHAEGFDARENQIDSSNIEGKTGPNRQGGFAFDWTAKADPATMDNSHMRTPDIAKGLEALIKKYRGGNAFDIIGSDSCLNQQVEFGLEFENVGDYIFGSATVMQAKGSNYGTLLRHITTSPKGIRSDSGKTENVAREIVELYKKTVSAKGQDLRHGHYDEKATMAVWKASKLRPLRNAIDDLGKALITWVTAPKGEEAQFNRREEINEQIVSETLRFHGISNDFHNFLLHLDSWVATKVRTVSADPEQTKQLKAIAKESSLARHLLMDSVLHKHLGKAYRSDRGWENSQGVAIWLPFHQDEFNEMYPRFRDHSRLYQDSYWSSFIESLFCPMEELEKLRP